MKHARCGLAATSLDDSARIRNGILAVTISLQISLLVIQVGVITFQALAKHVDPQKGHIHKHLRQCSAL